jgi:oligoendopeptidase F
LNSHAPIEANYAFHLCHQTTLVYKEESTHGHHLRMDNVKTDSKHEDRSIRDEAAKDGISAYLQNRNRVQMMGGSEILLAS